MFCADAHRRRGTTIWCHNGNGVESPVAAALGLGRMRVAARAISLIPFEREIEVEEGGWIAARLTGGAETYAGFTAFAHTSPVYVRVPGSQFPRAEAIGAFIDEIGRSMRAVRKGFQLKATRHARWRRASSRKAGTLSPASCSSVRRRALFSQWPSGAPGCARTKSPDHHRRAAASRLRLIQSAPSANDADPAGAIRRVSGGD